MRHAAQRSLHAVAIACAGAWAVSNAWSEAPTTPPLDLRLEEKVATQLVQLDVTLHGPPEALRDLTAKDFTLVLGGKTVAELVVDGTCTPAPATGYRADAASPRAGVQAKASYLFYFDQAHLMAGGRVRSLQVARDLIPQLLASGARIRIVSSAAGLTTYSSWTRDPQALSDGLTQLEADGRQFDASSDREAIEIETLKRDAREIARCVALLGGQTRADSNRSATRRPIPDRCDREGHTGRLMAQVYDLQQEEVHRAKTSLERLGATLVELSETSSPKAIVYFADTLRINAGEHYLRALAEDPEVERVLSSNRAGVNLSSPSMGRNPAEFLQHFYQQLLTDAASVGIRFYTVEGQGLVATTTRQRDSQSALTSMALETGGRSFLNGVDADTVGNGVLSDMSCYYLLSFKPGDFRLDEPLSVFVAVSRAKVRVQTRTRLVIPSDQTRSITRLVGAYAGEIGMGDMDVRVSLIPVEVEKHSLKALIQVKVPARQNPSVPGKGWDIGATVVTQGTVEATFSKRVVSPPDGAPIVFEQQIEIPTDAVSDVTAVVHEIATDAIGTNRMETPVLGAGPDRNLVTPSAVVQLERVVIIRNGTATLKYASIAVPEDIPVDRARPIAILTVVCGDLRGGAMTVERTLVGETTVEFGSSPIEESTGSCVQLRDMIPASTLGAGLFRYRVALRHGADEVASGERVFHVLAGQGALPTTNAP